MSETKIHVLDERWRVLDDEHITWELDGGRKVRVRPQLPEDAEPWSHGAYPEVTVHLNDHEYEPPGAIIAWPGGQSGTEETTLPALMDALAHAARIAAAANQRIRDAESEAVQS